jgi:hypothetical protein
LVSAPCKLSQLHKYKVFSPFVDIVRFCAILIENNLVTNDTGGPAHPLWILSPVSQAMSRYLADVFHLLNSSLDPTVNQR